MHTRKTFLLAATIFMAVFSLAAVLAVLSASAAPASAAARIWQDDFNSPVLDGRWSSIHEDPTQWSLSARPGFLRILPPVAYTDVYHALVTPAPPGEFEMQTRLFITPTQNIQLAGLLVYRDDVNFLVVGRGYCSLSAPGCVGNGIYFVNIEGGNLSGTNYGTRLSTTSEAYLKVTRTGSTYTAYASADNVTWTMLGTHTDAATPRKVGLVTGNLNPVQQIARIPADFDYFQLVDQSFQIYLPAVDR